jgi:mannosyl-oligosaccharide glucosidase
MRLFLLLFFFAAAVVSKPDDKSDQSLLWGPYRPNLYFGIRPRLPQSLMTGLIWFSTVNYQSVQSAFPILVRNPSTRVLTVTLQGSRHECEQDDKLDSYAWIQYDPREGGVQEIKDSQNNVRITTEFLKVPGGNNGGSWAARIKGEPMDTCESGQVVSIVAANVHTMGISYSQPDAYFYSVLFRS